MIDLTPHDIGCTIWVDGGNLTVTGNGSIIAGVASSSCGVMVAKVFAKILAVPYSYLGPIIIMLTIIGSYATNMAVADVQIMAAAGILGLIFSVCHFNSAAMILGLVLGVICEGNFSRAYTIARGDLAGMFAFNSHPVACVLMSVSVILLMYPVLKWYVQYIRSHSLAR